QSGAGVWAEWRGGDQGSDDRSGDYSDRVAVGGSGDDLPSVDDPRAGFDDRADVGGIQFDDVFVDGASRGSAGAAGDVWDSKYAVVFSQRSDLSGASISGVAEGDYESGSVYLCGARIQVAAAEGNGAGGNCSGLDLPGDFCGGDAGVGGAVIQADAIGAGLRSREYLGRPSIDGRLVSGTTEQAAEKLRLRIR